MAHDRPNRATPSIRFFSQGFCILRSEIPHLAAASRTEQKYRANNVDHIDFLYRQGEKLIASGREKRLASDRSITIRGNEWYDQSKEHGGYAIDFVNNFYNLSFPEAVTLLLGGEQGIEYTPAKKKKQEQPKSFILPKAHSDMRRVYAYLVKTRKIDRDVVSYFAKEKLLYESCEKTKTAIKNITMQCLLDWMKTEYLAMPISEGSIPRASVLK